MGESLSENFNKGMGIARCICLTNAKLAIMQRTLYSLPPGGRGTTKWWKEPACRMNFAQAIPLRTLPQSPSVTAFGPGRKHSLLPALAKNMPPAYFLNASRPPGGSPWCVHARWEQPLSQPPSEREVARRAVTERFFSTRIQAIIVARLLPPACQRAAPISRGSMVKIYAFYPDKKCITKGGNPTCGFPRKPTRGLLPDRKSVV